MTNQVVFIGRLTADPEIVKVGKDATVCNLTVAVDGAGEDAVTSFIPTKAWNRLADNVAKFTKKGSLVCVVGRLQQRSFEDKNKNKRTVLEVIASSIQFLDSKSKDDKAFDEEVEEVEEAPKSKYSKNRR